MKMNAADNNSCSLARPTMLGCYGGKDLQGSLMDFNLLDSNFSEMWAVINKLVSSQSWKRYLWSVIYLVMKIFLTIDVRLLYSTTRKNDKPLNRIFKLHRLKNCMTLRALFSKLQWLQYRYFCGFEYNWILMQFCDLFHEKNTIQVIASSSRQMVE